MTEQMQLVNPGAKQRIPRSESHTQKRIGELKSVKERIQALTGMTNANYDALFIEFTCRYVEAYTGTDEQWRVQILQQREEGFWARFRRKWLANDEGILLNMEAEGLTRLSEAGYRGLKELWLNAGLKRIANQSEQEYEQLYND